jgi:hypothetical protein
MLIRVSTISANETQSYQVEEDFVRAMIGAMSDQSRRLVMGAD